MEKFFYNLVACSKVSLIILPFSDVIPNVGEADSISHSKPSAQKRKPRFEIPDLEPKKSDGRLIIDGEDMQEKVDNCKSQ